MIASHPALRSGSWECPRLSSCPTASQRAKLVSLQVLLRPPTSFHPRNCCPGPSLIISHLNDRKCLMSLPTTVLPLSSCWRFTLSVRAEKALVPMNAYGEPQHVKRTKAQPRPLPWPGTLWPRPSLAQKTTSGQGGEESSPADGWVGAFRAEVGAARTLKSLACLRTGPEPGLVELTEKRGQPGTAAREVACLGPVGPRWPLGEGRLLL